MLFKSKKVKDILKYAPNPNSSELEVNNWLLSELILKKLVPVVGVHPFPLNELMLISATIARFRPSLIFEWGTHVGKSARIFYEISEAIGIDSDIHSIDLPDEIDHSEHPGEQRGHMVKAVKRVNLHQGDGLDTALNILKTKKPTTYQQVLFFIDGDHSYKSVKRELTGVMTHCPKSTILLHDTFFQSSNSDYNVGPYNAINDCLKKVPNRYRRIDTATGLPGMTLLYPNRI